ncbi:hypothetical protein [Sphingobacterium wenxiniae]|uniref:Uncharacterized protein n=1 Tax=Sphingobacterium wenxiniae TaxID=683125 RepID=A0A1I6VPZ4_9SPHI|nr:hypothetical protein [Sphingobacterium wenxiniae]SFT15800.1 hypothetical protein SAMN05660206_11622 [Sphingobacterium wenxiniae]
MEWKKFNETSQELPDDILETFAKGFSEATDGLVQLNIKKLDSNDKLKNKILTNRFQFNVFLVSDFLDNFAYRLFIFGYDIGIYPVTVRMNVDIFTELEEQDVVNEQDHKYNNEESFKTIIESIFCTKTFENTVTGIMKIANKNRLTF